MATQQEVIKKFMKYLDTTSKKGEAALNAAIKVASNSAFKNFKTLKKAMVNNCKKAGEEKFLKSYCGIELDNDDTGAITGFDAGGSNIKTAESIVPEEGSLNEFTDGDSFDDIEGQDGLKVMLVKRTGSLADNLDNIAIRKFSELSNQEIYLWRSIYTWWIKSLMNLLMRSCGRISIISIIYLPLSKKVWQSLLTA